jgi:HAD superfamily hydrolase (TIGR01509 family)
MNKQYKLGKITDSEYWTWALKEWGLSISVQEIIDLLIAGYEINEAAVKYIKNARKAGYKTVICSNNFPARVAGLQKKFGFLDDFDVAVLSYEIGIDKPNIEIFRELIRKTNVKPDQIVFSDDDPLKMVGAVKLGINTFVYTDFETFIEKLVKLGVNVNTNV